MPAYTRKPGDNLIGVAQNLGPSVEAIAEVNPFIESPDFDFIGVAPIPGLGV